MRETAPIPASLGPGLVNVPEKSRNAGLDALRAVLTLLVLFHHTAITYGAAGGWFYHEIPNGRSITGKLLTFFCAINQAYFMGLFFLLAGYFVPRAIARRGAWNYAKERALRLGVPLLIFSFVIGPMTIALAQTAKGAPFTTTLWRLWSRATFEPGPLWFVLALLIFSFVFVIWQAIRSYWGPHAPARVRAFPSNAMLALAALLTGSAAFALRLVWPIGAELAGLQLGYFASYIVLFAAGCIGAGGRWCDDVPDDRRRLWQAFAWLALPVLPLTLVLGPHVKALQGDAAGGFNFPAMVYAFWEPLIAWGIILTLLHAFTRKFSTLPHGWRTLARRAYTIYIIHAPVLVGIALMARAMSMPALVKFMVTGVLTCLASFWIAGLLLRIPLARRIL